GSISYATTSEPKPSAKILPTMEPIRPVPITATFKSFIERDKILGCHLKSYVAVLFCISLKFLIKFNAWDTVYSAIEFGEYEGTLVITSSYCLANSRL